MKRGFIAGVLVLDCIDFNLVYLMYCQLTGSVVCSMDLAHTTVLTKYINIVYTPFLLQRCLLLILDVASTWTRAPVETIASAGTMTNRPMPVHSFGMEAVVEMTTVMKQKRNARGLVFNSEQVIFVYFLYGKYIHFSVIYCFLVIILSCPQLDKRRKSLKMMNFSALQPADVILIRYSVTCHLCL